jgi:hypothetical protein
LAHAEMKREAQHEKASDGFAGAPRIAPSVRHVLEDLERDAAIRGERIRVRQGIDQNSPWLSSK